MRPLYEGNNQVNVTVVSSNRIFTETYMLMVYREPDRTVELLEAAASLDGQLAAVGPQDESADGHIPHRGARGDLQRATDHLLVGHATGRRGHVSGRCRSSWSPKPIRSATDCSCSSA